MDCHTFPTSLADLHGHPYSGSTHLYIDTADTNSNCNDTLSWVNIRYLPESGDVYWR